MFYGILFIQSNKDVVMFLGNFLTVFMMLKLSDTFVLKFVEKSLDRTCEDLTYWCPHNFTASVIIL